MVLDPRDCPFRGVENKDIKGPVICNKFQIIFSKFVLLQVNSLKFANIKVLSMYLCILVVAHLFLNILLVLL